MPETALVAALVLSGLSAGLFYGWRVSVIPGTRRVSSSAYVETMQQINVAIINPAFLVVFTATPAVMAIAAGLHFADDAADAGWLLVAATIVYATTTIATTAARNIPLNDALDAFDLDGASGPEIDASRERYEGPWNRWHDVRTVSSVVAFTLVAIAAVSS